MAIVHIWWPISVSRDLNKLVFHITYPLTACTTNNIVTALEQAIEKDKEIFKFETPTDELKVVFYGESSTFDGMGRNIDAFSFLSVSPTQKLRK